MPGVPVERTTVRTTWMAARRGALGALSPDQRGARLTHRAREPNQSGRLCRRCLTGSRT